MMAFEIFEDVDHRDVGSSVEGADKWDGAGSVGNEYILAKIVTCHRKRTI
jgi:hypothetical protein